MYALCSRIRQSSKIDGPQSFLHDLSPTRKLISFQGTLYLHRPLEVEAPRTKSKLKRIKYFLQQQDVRGRMCLRCLQLLPFHSVFTCIMLSSRRDTPAAFVFGSVAWTLASKIFAGISELTSDSCVCLQQCVSPGAERVGRGKGCSNTAFHTFPVITVVSGCSCEHLCSFHVSGARNCLKETRKPKGIETK